MRHSSLSHKVRKLLQWSGRRRMLERPINSLIKKNPIHSLSHQWNSLFILPNGRVSLVYTVVYTSIFIILYNSIQKPGRKKAYSMDKALICLHYVLYCFGVSMFLLLCFIISISWLNCLLSYLPISISQDWDYFPS